MYNGWSNRGTWHCNLWMGEIFENLTKESDWSGNPEGLAKEFEEATWEVFDVNKYQDTLLLDVISDYIAQVNFLELAKHALE